MTDELAISLFVKAGNPRGDWPALDDRDRWPWRKLATQKNSSGATKWLARPYEGTEWRETDMQPTPELRRWLEFKPAEA